MKLRKILALTLALVLTFSALSVVSFAAEPVDISTCTVEEVKEQKHTGFSIAPELVVKTAGDEPTTLVKDTDYTVEFKNNTNYGTASYTITGKGNYTGTKTGSFEIVPNTPVDGVDYLDTDTNSTKEIEQNYDATVTKNYADVNKVQVSWTIPDIIASVTINKKWNTKTLTWDTESTTDSAEGATAEFNFVNLSSVKVAALVSFTAESAFANTTGKTDKYTETYKVNDEDAEKAETVIASAIPDHDSPESNIGTAPTGKIDFTVTPAAGAFTHLTEAQTDAKFGTYTVTIKKGFSVKFNGNKPAGVTGEIQNIPAQQDLADNSKVTEPTSPTLEGYSCAGWYKEDTCTNEWDFDNDTVTEETVLYAKWQKLGYFLNANGNVVGDYFSAKQVGVDASNVKTWNGYSDAVHIVFPEGVTSIKEYLFDCEAYAESPLNEITIPNTVTTIGESAFCAAGLQKVNFQSGSKLTTIGEYAFASNGFTNFEIPEGVTTIGKGAFSFCTSLQAITIASSVETIGSVTFDYCEALATVTFAEGSKLTTIGDSAFQACEALQEITIPSSVETIGENAFVFCYGLATVTFAEGSKLTTISYYAFAECPLQEITIPSSVKTIGSMAFIVCGSLATVTFAEGSKLTTIGDYAFGSCASLQAITIPSGVETIGKEAFSSCEKLATVTFAEGSKLTTIGEVAFQGCNALQAITIPSSVETIGERAFAGCGSMATVTFAEGSKLTTIGISAFSQCSLQEITIPSTVTSIDQQAFNCCDSLETVTYLGTVAEWNAITLGANWRYGTEITGITINGVLHTFGENDKISE